VKFGTFPVEQSVGVILAHTLRLDGQTLRKGHALTPSDLAQLRAAGQSHVVGARLGPGDVAEDPAAARIAARLSGAGVRLTEAHTGRCNLEAAKDGVVRVNAAAVTAANVVDESITIATLADLTAAKAGQVVATVKIIPFAVSSDALAKVETALGSGAVALSPFMPTKAALISTLLPGLKDTVVASTEALTQQRVKAVGGTLASSARCSHDESAVAAQIAQALAGGSTMILVSPASATVDRQDVVPAAVVAAGGSIEHVGMPVDPGNLLVVGRIGAVPVLVLPGCARSPKLNGFDWVLQRLAAGISVGRAEIMAMGVGGLLVDTPGRPLPRDTAVRPAASAKARKMAAVVLAAGQSRRMGSFNKLLMPIEGVALIRRTVETVIGAQVGPVIVVTGYQADELKAQLSGLEVRFVHNPRHDEGLSTSLRVGLDAVPADCDAAIICLGDMPSVTSAHIGALARGFDPDAGRAIGLPVHAGKRGNPVLWARRFFADMKALSGDVGARHLISANESLVYEVEFEDTAVLTDLDTPQQWADFMSGRPRI
jgi:molybdenum cofactor cytidylyltransferase